MGLEWCFAGECGLKSGGEGRLGCANPSLWRHEVAVEGVSPFCTPAAVNAVYGLNNLSDIAIIRREETKGRIVHISML